MKHLPVLPEMRCDQGCTLCCSDVVPVSEQELVTVLAYANEHDVRPQVETPDLCVWYQNGRCAVYDARPTVCRLYGHSDHPSLTCPRGYNTNVSDETIGAHMSGVGGPPVRYLHEVIDAALPDPTQSIWRARVQEPVWEGVNRFRAAVGLAPLSRAYQPTSEGRIVPV
jgi:hypothetical protein